jgi:hypothetical protein
MGATVQQGTDMWWPQGTDMSWLQRTDRQRRRRCKVSGWTGAPVVPALAVSNTKGAQRISVCRGLHALRDDARIAAFGEIDK